jgi:integrase/recombinase XerD
MTRGIETHVAELVVRMELRDYAPATITQTRWLLSDFARYLDNHRLDDLRAVLPRHIEQYAAWLHSRELSTSTRSQALRAVARLFDDLLNRGVLLSAPTSRIKIPHRKTVLPRRVPTQKEMRQLLAAANTHRNTGIRDRALLELLYGSALRINELCGLAVDDVDLGDRVARVMGKGARERVVPLSDAATSWLQRYLAEIRPRWLRRRPPQAALFLTNRGEPLSTNTTRSNLWSLCRKARVPRISPHAVRHAAATHLLQAGADVRQVQVLLGHASIASTQIYTRVVPLEVKATHARTHPRELGL